jgi:uncharacterized membrane protein HdeD (DUF308 family)
MKCSYHPGVESVGVCSACGRTLCNECAHRIKGKTCCQDCLMDGVEWATTMRGFDSPTKATLCALIPGMGAVYNNEYLKALTFFAVFAALIMMEDISGVFVLAAIVFLIFTMFEAHRSAVFKARKRLETGVSQDLSKPDKTVVGWGVVLIVIGILFLLHNFYPLDLIYKYWPVIFILLGAYLVYRSLREHKDQKQDSRNLLD